MIDEKLKDLKTLIPDFDEIDSTKEEILKKKETKKEITFNFKNKRVLSFAFSIVLIFFIIGITSVLISNYSNTKKAENNKEKVKSEISQIVQDIDKSSTIQNSDEFVDQIINEKVDSVTSSTTEDEMKDIINKTLENIMLFIITEDASIDLLETLVESGKYNGGLLGSPGPSNPPKPRPNEKEGFRFYGTYNNASVIFSIEPGDMEMEIEIYNYKFMYSSVFEMYVINDGATYKLSNNEDLSHVLENNILTEKDVDKMYQLHTTWNK